MAHNRSYAKILQEWRLLMSPGEGEDAMPLLPRQEKLAQLFEQAIALGVEQARHTTEKQKASLRLAETIDLGEEVARDLKAELRGYHGSRSEELVRYRMKPLREGGRRRKTKRGQDAEGAEGADTGAPPESSS